MELSRTKLGMGTLVNVRVVLADRGGEVEAKEQIERAFQLFAAVEQACSRFARDSELTRACCRIGEPVPVGPILFETLRFALEMADRTDGAFDPAAGRIQERLGFNRHYKTGNSIDNAKAAGEATYRDIVLDESRRTLLLKKPLVLDLGAVAKGFAIDLAAGALRRFDGFLIEAGGDVYAGGLDATGSPWPIGIQHPGRAGAIVDIVRMSNQALCTSGGYERQSPAVPGMCHLIDARSQRSPAFWSSCSVIAPFAMLADALSTAAYLLEPRSGEALIEEAGMHGILLTPEWQIKRVGGEKT